MHTCVTGLEYATKAFQMFGSKVKVQVWDSGGGMCPEKMTKAYFKGAIGAVIVYDVNDRNSFDNVQKVWLKQLHAFGQGDLRTVLVANKCELQESLAEDCAVSEEQGRVLAQVSGLSNHWTPTLASLPRKYPPDTNTTSPQVLGLPLAHVSAKEGTNVAPAFNWLVHQLSQNVSELLVGMEVHL
jgi:small GTP-binding protein